MVVGCGTAPEGDPCPGEPPAFDQCYAGYFFADCGGDGDPRFACSPDHGCRWFQDGCVAVGFEASPCPADDICCVDDWPFADGAYPAAWRSLYGLGTAPWRRATGA